MLELIFHRCDPSHSSVGIDQVFIDLVLRPLVTEFPTLKVVMEHITTADAVAFVRDELAGLANVAATITAHHLLYNRCVVAITVAKLPRYCNQLQLIT